ncbi:ANTAR domain-containing protein [Klenkia soli]|nr:ANTAR domain-containing protein [Klenkia soli]
MDDLLHVHADVGAARTVTLTLVGELDHLGAGPLARVLARTWAARPGGLTLDLRQLEFINARGLACLLGASRTARRRGVPLVLLCAPGLVSRMVTLVGLADRPAAPDVPVLTLVPRVPPALELVDAAGERSAAPPGAHGAEARCTALVELDLALSVTGADLAATREVVVARLAADVPAADHVAVCGASGRRTPADATCSSVDAAALTALQVSAREGPADDARRLRATVHVADLHRDERWPRLARQASRQAARSVLTIPLVHEGQLVGVLTLHSDRPDAFDPAARELAGALAARAATALGAAAVRVGLEQALRSRDVIGQGKGILMARYGLTAPQAFALLSRTSQERNVRVVDLAEELARTGVL